MNNLYKLFTFILLSFITVNAQNQIDGNVKSFESNALARVTFTDTSTNQQYIAITDSVTGDFSLNVPSGTYKRKVEVQNNFLFEDQVAISSSTSMQLQTIADIGNPSAAYNTILDVVKVLTRTRDGFPSTIMERWRDEDRPIKFYARNYNPADSLSMPLNYRAFLDSAINDIGIKSNWTATFSEQSSPVSVGINFIFVKPPQMPLQGDGYTEVLEYYGDNSPKLVKIYINRENMSGDGKNFIFRRELLRALGTIDDDVLDNHFIMSYIPVWPTTELHWAEGRVLEIMNRMRNLTQMTSHKPIKITDPVPVELSSFIGDINNNIVTLRWKTETEVNNYGFDIERRSSQKWEKIRFIPGHGNSNIPHEYSTADTLKEKGKYLYRLKQIDVGGKAEYSPEVLITLEDAVKEYLMMQNYPNPFNPNTKIKYAISSPQYATLKVYDILGNEVATLVDEYKPAGNYEIEFNAVETLHATSLPSGVYFYRLKAGEFVETKKMILLR